MTTILRPGVEKVMRIFYAEKWGDLHLRGLARKTGLQGQSITRHLDFLEKAGYLAARMEGNQKRYSIKPSARVFALFTLFDIEKFDRLPRIRKQAVETYLAHLAHQPIYAILFGSTAKESYREQSDIDVLIIADTRIDTAPAEKEADALHAQRISTFQMPYGAFMKELRLKEDNVVQSALHTGYPLLNHIRYYEALAHERV